MKVYVYDSVALDFAITLGFKDLYLPHIRSNEDGECIVEENNSGLRNYVLNKPFTIVENQDILSNPDVEKLLDYNLLILPLYLKQAINKDMSSKLNIAFYGTSDMFSKKDKDNKMLEYVDSSNNTWPATCSPLVSFNYLSQELEALGIEVPNDPRQIEREYSNTLSELEIRELKNATVGFAYQSSTSDDHVFIYSPGLMSDMYDSLNLKFPKVEVKTEHTGISVNNKELVKSLYKKFDYIFFAPHDGKDKEQNEELRRVAKALSKFEAFEIPNDTSFQMLTIDGMLSLLDIVQGKINEAKGEKINTLIRIIDAHEARDFYKDVLGFEEKYKYFYSDREEGGKYKGKLIRSSLYKYNFEFVIGEAMPDRKNAFASFQIKENQYDTSVDDLFDMLAKDGTIITKYEENFTGNKYGEVLDKFGVHWEIKTIS